MHLTRVKIATLVVMSFCSSNCAVLSQSRSELKSSDLKVEPFSKTIDKIVDSKNSENLDLLNRANALLLREPNNAQYFAARGQVNKDLGRYGPALADFDSAIRLNPDVQVYHTIRAAVLGRLRRYPEELTEIDIALKKGTPTADLFEMRSSVLAILKRYPEALRDANDSLRLDPKFAKAYAARAQISLIQNDFKKARQDCDEALRLAPDDTYIQKLSSDIDAHR